MNVTFTLIVIIAVLVFILYAVVYKAIGLKKDCNRLEKLMAEYKESLCEYMTELALIKKDGATVQKEIENAETEEEILDILGNIINRNNDRVSDNKTKK
jgi:predicted Holliday junction resolvase-like endonuclease